MREAARGFHETQLDASTLVYLGFQRRLVRVDSCRGWSDLLCLSVRQGGFEAHMMLRNKDLTARIRYSSIPESSDRITWIPGQVRKGKNFNFFVVYVCLTASRNPTITCRLRLDRVRKGKNFNFSVVYVCLTASRNLTITCRLRLVEPY